MDKCEETSTWTMHSMTAEAIDQFEELCAKQKIEWEKYRSSSATPEESTYVFIELLRLIGEVFPTRQLFIGGVLSDQHLTDHFLVDAFVSLLRFRKALEEGRPIFPPDPCDEEHTLQSLRTRRRLRDGQLAMDEPTDYAGLHPLKLAKIRTTLTNGIRALQSLDDLGSEEANDKVWSDVLELQSRLKTLDALFPADPCF